MAITKPTRKAKNMISRKKAARSVKCGAVMERPHALSTKASLATILEKITKADELKLKPRFKHNGEYTDIIDNLPAISDS